jgi:hypothetical protein
MSIDILCNDVILEIVHLLKFNHVVCLKSTCHRYYKIISSQVVKNSIIKIFKSHADYNKHVFNIFTYENFNIDGIDGLDLLMLYDKAYPEFIKLNSGKLLKSTFKLQCEKRLKFLLSSGVDPNADISYKRDKYSMISTFKNISALHYLIKRKYGFKGYFFDWAIEQLLTSGADPNKKVLINKFDVCEELTVLDRVIYCKNTRYLTPLLLQYGATCNMYKYKKIAKIMNSL